MSYSLKLVDSRLVDQRNSAPSHQGHEWAFQRSTDGLFAAVIAHTLKEARRLAREAFAENDAAPAWRKQPDGSSVMLGMTLDGSYVAAINDEKKYLKLADGRLVFTVGSAG